MEGGARREGSLASVLTALAANTTIATAKGVAWILTGSPALLAETLHTLADTGNEVLLWIALRRSRRPADATHPLGYGPERYYWALLAAIGMFVIGGAVSICEGVSALFNPPELATFCVGVAVLLIALTLDSISRMVAVRLAR
jgi:cation diffusion facilitator family transporter